MELKQGYKQTEVGIIPQDWDVLPLLSTVRIANGQVDPKAEPFRSMVLVAPDHIESCTGRLLKKATAFEQRAISGKYLFKSQDIVYSKIRPYLRKAVLVDFQGLCSADMYPLTSMSNVCPGFIFAIILGHHFSKYAESVSVRSGMPKINRIELADYRLPLPPTHAEQEAIAGALSDADAWIESLEQLIAKKRQIKQGTMQELLTGKRRLPGFSGEWVVKLLSSLCNRITTGKLDANAMSDFGKYPFYTCAREHSWIDTFAFDDESLLVSGNGANVGYVHYYSGKFNAYQRTYVLTDFTADIHFLKLYMEVYLSERIRTEVNAGNTPYITMGTLTEMQVVLPSDRREQTAIAAILSDIDTELAMLATKLTKARQIKQGMMQELLTGRIRLI